ncbi:hypothetical protein [Acinetobacter sp. P8-3-8]|nr:hypothetical protein [Acinetobacter sp. P8-3-8]
MKLLKIIGVGLIAGYCYKKVKAKKAEAKHSKSAESENSLA